MSEARKAQVPVSELVAESIVVTQELLLTDGVVLLDRFTDTDTDVDSLWAGEDDDYVRRSGLPGPFTRRDIANQIRHWQKQWQLGGSGRSFAVRETETRRLVGGCVLEIRPDDRDIAELSYWVFPPYRCRGYATRSVELVCRYAFNYLGIGRMDLYIEPTNDASLRVATKAGFLQEGLLRQHDRCHGGRWDLVLFSRLRTDGPQSGTPDSENKLSRTESPKQRLPVRKKAARNRASLGRGHRPAVLSAGRHTTLQDGRSGPSTANAWLLGELRFGEINKAGPNQ